MLQILNVVIVSSLTDVCRDSGMCTEVSHSATQIINPLMLDHCSGYKEVNNCLKNLQSNSKKVEFENLHDLMIFFPSCTVNNSNHYLVT